MNWTTRATGREPSHDSRWRFGSAPGADFTYRFPAIAEAVQAVRGLNAGKALMRLVNGAKGIAKNEVAGTRHLFRLPSQPRQCGLETFRMFVTGAPPY
jgi:hypothetical protein